MMQHVVKLLHKCEKAHLTQLLVQSGSSGLSCSVTLGAEHLLVPVNEVAMAQSDHLHTDKPAKGQDERFTSLAHVPLHR